MEIFSSKELPASRNEGFVKPASAKNGAAKADRSVFKRALENNPDIKPEVTNGAKKTTNLKRASNNDAAGKPEDKSDAATSRSQLEASAMMFLAGLAAIPPGKDSMSVAAENEKDGSGMGAYSSNADMTLQDLFARFDAVASANNSATASPAMTLQDLFARFNAAASANNSAALSPAVSPAMTLQDLFARFNAAASANNSATASPAMTLQDLFARFNAAASANNSATASPALTLQDLFARFDAVASANNSATASPAITLQDLFAKFNAGASTNSMKASPAGTPLDLSGGADSAMADNAATAQADLNPAMPVADKTQKTAGKSGKKPASGMPEKQGADSKAETSNGLDSTMDFKQIKAELNSLSRDLDKHTGADHSAGRDQEAKAAFSDLNAVNTKTEAVFIQQANRTSSGDIAAGQRMEKAEAQTLAQPLVDENTFILTKKDEASIGISIEPDGLGKLDIQLSLEKGTVNAHINASQTVGKDMIEKNINQIMDALAKEGLNVGGFSVSLRNKNGYANNKSEKDGSGNGYVRNIESIENSVSLRGYAGNNRISIFV